MAYVEVDIDLSEFTTGELVEEMTRRLKSHRESKIQINSLDDKMKLAHLESVWEKYSWAELQERIPD